MALPLSAGDCIAIIGVAIQGYNALSSTSDDAKELGSLQDDLQHMREILEQLRKPDSNLSSISEANIRRLDDTVSRCQTTLSELAAVMKKYGPSNSTIRTSYRRMAWTFSGKMKVLPFQTRIQRLTTTLSLIQADINRQAIEELKVDINQRTEGLSLQMREDKEEVKFHIYAAIDEPWDQKPIKFQDATGRRFPVPLEVCQRFEDFFDFLKFSFKTLKGIMPFVTRKDFWLFTPSSNAPWWYLINENDWAEVARPGMRLGMSLFQADHIQWLPPGVYSCGYADYSNLGRRKKTWPLVRGPEEDSYIRFSRPVPFWSSLPANLEFRWRSQPAASGPIAMAEPTADERRRNVMNSFISAGSASSHVHTWRAESQYSIPAPQYSGFRVIQDDI